MPDPCRPVDPAIAMLLSLESVPPVSTTRWSARRKAQVVRAVQAGLLTEDEAQRFYRMTAEELGGWQCALAQAGERGLRVTKRIRAGRSEQRHGEWVMPRPALAHWSHDHDQRG